MGFAGAVEAGYRNYFNFSGRATRAEYWWFWLWYTVLTCVTAMLAVAGITSGRSGNTAGGLALDLLGVVMGLGVVASIIPLLSAEVRRLHDAGHSGKWILLQILLGGLQVGLSGVGQVSPNSGVHGVLLGVLLVVFLIEVGLNIAIFIFLVQRSRPSSSSWG
jgi:uncharacterized membrane protein YhaH (DUF805 family)